MVESWKFMMEVIMGNITGRKVRCGPRNLRRGSESPPMSKWRKGAIGERAQVEVRALMEVRAQVDVRALMEVRVQVEKGCKRREDARGGEDARKKKPPPPVARRITG